MNRICLYVTLIFALLGCNAINPTYTTVGKKTDDPNCPDYSEVQPGFYGGDGSSEAQAIEMVGIDYTPYRWIEENYPGAKPLMQALIQSRSTGLKYDLIKFESANGTNKEAYFRISGGLSCFLKDM